jgi:hypothetical protein
MNWEDIEIGDYYIMHEGGNSNISIYNFSYKYTPKYFYADPTKSNPDRTVCSEGDEVWEMEPVNCSGYLEEKHKREIDKYEFDSYTSNDGDFAFKKKDLPKYKDYIKLASIK